jgi:hypothetical protein
VVGDVHVDSEGPVMTLSILRFADSTQFFGGAHRGSVGVCVHRGKCALVYMSIYVCNWVSQKKVSNGYKVSPLPLLTND